MSEENIDNKIGLRILFVILLIIGAFIGWILLSLHQFMENEKARAMATSETTETTYDPYNDIDVVLGNKPFPKS
jgi:hypothetical protein